MKKTFFAILLTVFCFSAFAKIKIRSGNTNFLKEKSTAVLVLDYSETTWEEDQSYKNYCGEEFEERVNLSYVNFSIGFNKQNDNLKISEDSSSAKYRIIVKISNIEQRYGGSGWGRFYALCSGTITVEEISTGNVICAAQFDKEDGNADYSQNDRIAKCFNALGKATAKMK